MWTDKVIMQRSESCDNRRLWWWGLYFWWWRSNSHTNYHNTEVPYSDIEIIATMRLALARAGHSTLHSLRRGGAQVCAHLGICLDDIKELSTWRSEAVHTNVPRSCASSSNILLALRPLVIQPGKWVDFRTIGHRPGRVRTTIYVLYSC